MSNSKPTLSEKVLKEILTRYAQVPSVPGRQTLEELANSAGVSTQVVRNHYEQAYAAAGEEGDPWGMPSPILDDGR